MYSVIFFVGAKKKEEQSGDKLLNAILIHWVVFFLDTGYNNHRYGPAIYGAGVLEFPRRRNIPLQTVIQGRRQSLWRTARRRDYIRDITHRINDGMCKKVENKDWQ